VPELHFPPLVPALLGLAAQVFDDPHTGTVVLTALCSTALILPLAGLARRIAGPVAGTTTAWVAAVAPAFSTTLVNRGAGSEAEYVLLVTSAVWCVVSAADARGKDRLVRAGGAGLLVGLAYLTRPEGLFFAVPVGLGILYLGLRERHLRSALPVALCFAVPLMACIVPYTAFLYRHTGEVQLSAKTQDVSIEAWHAVAAGDRERRDSELWALDETGLRLANTDHRSLPALAADDPAGYAAILGVNVAQLAEELTFPDKGQVLAWLLLPAPLWLLVGVGAWRFRRSWSTRLVAAAALLPATTALIFFVQPRYLVVTTAFATVLVGAGAPSITRRWRGPVVGAALVLCLVSSVAGFRSPGAGWWHPTEGLDQRRAGEWLAANTGPDDRIMTRSMVVELYADRPAMALPYAEMKDIVDYARHHGARYVVVDWYSLVRLRPQLEPMAEPWFTHPELDLVWMQRHEGRTTRIYALDPSPPDGRPMGVPLGFVGDS
jgi:4-amino-4-deoxy-L-arabinose transferase-like glycosyltransferase